MYIPTNLPYTAKMPVVELKPATISKIELSESDTIKLKRVLNSKQMADWSKAVNRRKIIGICDCCGQVPYVHRYKIL